MLNITVPDAFERSCGKIADHGKDDGDDVDDTHFADDGHGICWEDLLVRLV